MKRTIIISRRGKAIITGCKTKKDLNKLFYLFTGKNYGIRNFNVKVFYCDFKSIVYNFLCN